MCAQLHDRSCEHPPSCVKRKASGSPLTHQFQHNPSSRSRDTEKGCACAHTCTPPVTFIKRQTNGSLTTYKISAQSVQALTRRKRGTHLHVCTCRCTPPMPCALCAASWSLSTHQIWPQLAEPFLSYSLSANFDTLHAARTTWEGNPSNEPNTVVINFYNLCLPFCEVCM